MENLFIFIIMFVTLPPIIAVTLGVIIGLIMRRCDKKRRNRCEEKS